MKWSDYIESLGRSFASNGGSHFVPDNLSSQDSACTFIYLLLHCLLNISNICGLIHLYLMRFSTKSKDGSVILCILIWHLDYSHLSTTMTWFPSGFSIFSCGLSWWALCLLTRPHQFKHTTRLAFGCHGFLLINVDVIITYILILSYLELLVCGTDFRFLASMSPRILNNINACRL